MPNKKTLVIGASENDERYSNMAIKLLNKYGHDVVAIGKRKGRVGNVVIETEQMHMLDIDTVTLYINPVLQKKYYEYILSLQPKRILFNPGTENTELKQLAEAQGIFTEDACTLVLLRLGQY
jgi:predicted CoA-binding protein